MSVFYKALAGVLITVILCVFLAKSNKDYSTLITMTACCLIIISAITYLQPVMDFISRLKRIADLDNEAVSTIVKAVGVGVITEIVGMICADAGYASLDKALKLVTSAVILWLSIPLFEALLALLETILGNI